MGTHAGSISAVALRSPALKASYRLMTLLIKSLIRRRRSACSHPVSEREERKRGKGDGPIESGWFSELSAIHFCSLGWTCRHFWAICCEPANTNTRQSARSVDRASANGKQATHVIRITLDEPFLRIRVIEHLVEQQDALLHPVELLRDLLLVVRFLLRFLWASRGGKSREEGVRGGGGERTAPAIIFINSCAAARSFGVPRRISSCNFCEDRKAQKKSVSGLSRPETGSLVGSGSHRCLRFSVLLFQLVRGLQALRERTHVSLRRERTTKRKRRTSVGLRTETACRSNCGNR